MSIKWYYQIMGDVFGPIDRETLFELAANHDINRDTYVRRQNEDWVTADGIEGLFRPIPPDKNERPRRLGEIIGHRNPFYFSKVQK